jgi:uncharacterized protein (DUF2062 family)
MESIKRACKYFYYRFIRLQATPESLARGVALGLFISTTPTFGIQTFIALFFAAICRCSKLAAVVAAQLTNALTAPFIFLGTYYLGASIMDSPFSQAKLEQLLAGFHWDDVWTSGVSAFAPLWEGFQDVFISLWVGGLVVGVILAVIGYFTVLGIDTKAHMQIIRAKKQVERLKRLKQKNAPVYEKID